MTFDELYQITYNAGIVGAGGAGFPTHKKFSKDVKQIVVNAAECEPLMMVDHHILEKHLRALIDTLNILIDAMDADEAIIGIKGKNMHLLDSDIVSSLTGTKIKIHEIPDIYPAGDEVVLVYETTGKIIPEGSIPIMVGVMVINAETVYNIYNAITRSRPVTTKYITIGGDTKEDITIKAPIGMNIAELLSACGVSSDGKCVIDGGPMMGKLIDTASAVVTKTTKGLLLFPETHSVIQRRKMPMSVTLKRAAAACCGCSMCSDMCPRYLLGYSIRVDKTIRAASHSEVQNAESFLQSALCCGCGICTVIGCQQMLNPQAVSMEVKRLLGKNGFKRQNNKAPENVRPERASRLVSSSKLIDRLGIRKYVKDKVERKYIEFNPKTVVIPLSQHVGKPASPIIKKGTRITAGTPIAMTDKNALGAVIHASIDGKIKEITDTHIIIEA
jgi:Na+-translocating ferredoxin:NAD+ oxidoreductase RnfC subunit